MQQERQHHKHPECSLAEKLIKPGIDSHLFDCGSIMTPAGTWAGVQGQAGWPLSCTSPVILQNVGYGLNPTTSRQGRWCRLTLQKRPRCRGGVTFKDTQRVRGRAGVQSWGALPPEPASFPLYPTALLKRCPLPGTFYKHYFI